MCATEQRWACKINTTGICNGASLPMAVCAPDQDTAQRIAAQQGISIVQPGEKITSAECDPLISAPSIMPESVPGAPCQVDPSDDPCTVCAKTSCCADVTACLSDANCSCLVPCLAAGETLDQCSASGCGALGPVASALAICLDQACPAECLGSMGSGNCGSTSSSSSSSSSSGSGCTPGSGASGDPCFSDGDCASCTCDTQTMTCL